MRQNSCYESICNRALLIIGTKNKRSWRNRSVAKTPQLHSTGEKWICRSGLWFTLRTLESVVRDVTCSSIVGNETQKQLQVFLSIFNQVLCSAYMFPLHLQNNWIVSCSRRNESRKNFRTCKMQGVMMLHYKWTTNCCVGALPGSTVVQRTVSFDSCSKNLQQSYLSMKSFNSKVLAL